MPKIDESLRALAEAREHDPFGVLGLHRDGSGWRLRVLRPGIRSVAVKAGGDFVPLRRIADTDFFEWQGTVAPATPCQLRVDDGSAIRLEFDPYSFAPQPLPDDLFLFAEGSNYQSYLFLGALPDSRDGVRGITFRVDGDGGVEDSRLA